MIFASTDSTFEYLTVWLVQNDFFATSAVVNELFLRVLPPALAGLTAGYLAFPQGFSAAAFAGLTGAILSLALRYLYTVDWATLGLFNAIGMCSWVAGMAIASGICGWAGERLRTKAVRKHGVLE